LVSRRVKNVDLDIFEKDDVTIVVPSRARLDAEVAGEFRTTLIGLVDGGHRKLVLDIPAVDFIDSSGLGALVSALKHLKQLDGTADIRLAGVQPAVAAVLEIIRLNRVFTQFPTVDEAVRSFGGAAGRR
jgi:anti-anti-sigma factor